MRVIGNEYNLGNGLFQLLGNADASFYNIDVVNRSLQMKMSSFAEAGVSYGRVIFKNKASELKLGITGKYVVGLAYGSVSSGPLLLNLDPTNLVVKMNGEVTTQYSKNLDNLGNGANVLNALTKGGTSGLGLDFGLVYEIKKSQNPDQYRWRFGVSITDIGSVKYNNSPNSQVYTLTTVGHNTQEFEMQGGETYDDYFNRLKTNGLITTKSAAPASKISLPTALHGNIDYNIFKRLYINADVLFNMVANTSPINPNYITTVTVTPRLEKKWLSIYSPVSYNAQGQLNWGAGVRFGPLFVGSGSVISTFLTQRIKAADVHIGLSIPIFQHTDKHSKEDTLYLSKDLTHDRDGDGVVDDKDECPDSAGAIALIGCPDSDGDGVPNHKDKCPGVKGSPNFEGCPAPDTDGDSVNDDDDKCPLVKGVASNYGCPPINPALIASVNDVANRVFFVRAKADIKPVSHHELDRVVAILQSDSTLRLRVEGYTDSEGTDERNQRLSDRRARSVVHYLMKKGINVLRMDFVGYGSKHPLDTNDTREGMARNRRVEMVLMNYPKDKRKAPAKKTAPAPKDRPSEL